MSGSVVSGSWATSSSLIDDETEAEPIRRLHHHLTQMASVSGYESWAGLKAECPLTHAHHVKRALVRMREEDRLAAMRAHHARHVALIRKQNVERHIEAMRRAWSSVTPDSDSVCTPVQTHLTARVVRTVVDEDGDKFDIVTEYGSELSVVAQEFRDFTSVHVGEPNCSIDGKATLNCPACRANNTLNYRYTEEFGRGWTESRGPWLIGTRAIAIRLTHEHDCFRHQWPSSYDRTTVICPTSCPHRRSHSFTVWMAEDNGWVVTSKGKTVREHKPFRLVRFDSESQARDLFDRVVSAIGNDEMNRRPDDWEFHPGESTPYAPESIDHMAEDDGGMALA